MLKDVIQNLNPTPIVEGKGIKVYHLIKEQYMYDRRATIEAFDDYHEIDWHANKLTRETGRKVRSVELGFVEGMPEHKGYLGLFYIGRKPAKRVILSLIKKVVKKHPHFDVIGDNAIKCLMKGKNVLRDEEGAYYCEKGGAY